MTTLSSPRPAAAPAVAQGGPWPGSPARCLAVLAGLLGVGAAALRASATRRQTAASIWAPGVPAPAMRWPAARRTCTGNGRAARVGQAAGPADPDLAAKSGSGTAVVMNANGSRPVAVRISAAALPALP